MVKVLGVITVATIISILRWYSYQSVHNKRGQPFAEPRVCNQENDHDVGHCLEGANENGEGSNNDPILGPQHKIFLSHSGAQKEFVDHLCKALEDRCYYPFFDRRHESLPKGERFPELIVRAVEQCEMLIVVVSNEYFMSKWPMIELSAFVKAHKLHHRINIGPKILPLFYGLSVSDLDNEERQKKWFQEWKTLAEVDPKKRINVSDWKYAFNALRSFNGLSYDKNLKEVVAYEDKIVSHVCKSITLDIKWDDSHVQGKSSICKVIGEKIDGIGVSRKYEVKVVGIYGVGGIGKTTTCKTLCNEISNKYEGKVCHIEFSNDPSSDSTELYQKVLRDLTRTSVQVFQQLDEGECKYILRRSLFKQRTFLAIDNISHNHQSIQHAKAFLEFPYHMDSLVVVTARSLGILELLGLDGDACLEMPDLGEADAMNLFLHHAAHGKQFFEDGERHDIMTCIRRCYFSKGNEGAHHYHPLALEALGLQLGCHGESPSLWVKHLPCVRAFNFFEGENPVFDILRNSFDLLLPRDQALFIDLGCFSNWMSRHSFLDIEWLCVVHKQDEEEIALRLENLKLKGLLQDVDLRSGRISMHDLYLEFAELEAMGSFKKSANLKDRMWVYIKNNNLTKLEHKPEGGFWHNLIRVSIIQSSLGPKEHGGIVDQIGGVANIKWDYFSNVEVLELCGLNWHCDALNLEGLLRLRILKLHNVMAIHRVKGLEKLKHLTIFKWTSLLYPTNGIAGIIWEPLPSSLKELRIVGDRVIFTPDLLIRCHQLRMLSLACVESFSLDISNCSSLESVSLGKNQKLETLSILSAYPPSRLHYLAIHDCKELIAIPGIDHLIGLKKLYISDCTQWKVPSLLAFTELQVLSISGQQRLAVPAKDCFPCQLRDLCWCLSQSSEVLNLLGFNQLEVLDLSWSDGLTTMAEVGDLLALRRLNLRYCEYLLQLPNLSKSRNLKELNLLGCSALKLHEKDIQMLSELPLLQPVFFSGKDEQRTFMLDLLRGKVLVHKVPRATRLELWKLGDWEERDLGAPPIKIGRRGTWELDLVANN